MVQIRRFRPPLGPMKRFLRPLRRRLPPINFITLHYSYFILTSLFSGILFWGVSTPVRSVSFTDSLFLTTSAMSLAGLNTINLSAINTFQQVLLFFLIMFGSAIFVSSFVIHIRRKAFELKLSSVVQRKRELKLKTGLSIGRTITSERLSSKLPTPLKDRRNSDQVGTGDQLNLDIPLEGILSNSKPSKSTEDYDGGEKARAGDIGDESHDCSKPLQPDDNGLIHKDSSNVVDRQPQMDQKHPGSAAEEHIFFATEDPGSPLSQTMHLRSRTRRRVLSMSGVGARPDADIRTTSAASSGKLRSYPTAEKDNSVFDPSQFPKGHIMHNSSFVGLTDEDREALGGVEYRAIRFLSILVPIYFCFWQTFGCVALGLYVSYNRPDVARSNGLGPFWVGAFNAISAFNNSGMSLLDANMIAFQDSVTMLVIAGILILAGNTGYPIFLRFIIWIMWRVYRRFGSDDRRNLSLTLRFLLDHPRRCYTNLFPSQHTWWLLFAVILLNTIDWISFEILNIGNTAITSIRPGIRILDGLFQALAVRSGGFYVVPMSSIRIGLQILYVIMMYISVYPVVITMRNSNVYEERSLGIYADDPDYDTKNDMTETFFGTVKKHVANFMPGRTRGYFIQQQLKAQLAHDIWWIVLAILAIMVVETSQFERDPVNFSVFNVVFEAVSAYGTVGISIGVPDNAYSFSGSWHKLSKLILCAVMLRGRHRGLPVAIDKAVMLPNESHFATEEEDGQRRLEKRNTQAYNV